MLKIHIYCHSVANHFPACLSPDTITIHRRSTAVVTGGHFPKHLIRWSVILPVRSTRREVVLTADVLCLLVLYCLQFGTVGDTVTKSTAVGTTNFPCAHTHMQAYSQLDS